MVLDQRLCITVVAINPSLCILKLGRHWLTFNGTLKVPELHFHVDYATAADGTTVRPFHMLVVASMMDAMATTHEDNRLWGCKHVFTTNRTVAVCRAFNAAMSLSDANGKTDTASLCSR